MTDIVIITPCEFWIPEKDWKICKDVFQDIKRYLELPNGIPSHDTDTIERVMITIESETTEVLLRK